MRDLPRSSAPSAVSRAWEIQRWCPVSSGDVKRALALLPLLGLAACGGAPASPPHVEGPPSATEAGAASKSGDASTTGAGREAGAASGAGAIGRPAEGAHAGDGSEPTGAFEDHGACISRATDWKAVERWAESLERPKTLQDDDPPLETWIQKEGGDVGGKVDGHTVAFFVQTVRGGMEQQIREVVAVETDRGLAACVIHDELLQFGYLQPPTPVRGSLRAFPGGGFSYLAHHEWNGAALGDEYELGWEIRCVVREHRLGCVAATTQRVDRRKDFDTGKISEVVREAKLVWRGDVLEWTRDGKTVTTELTAGSAKNIDWVGQPVTIEVKGTLTP
jgi:hypothetical protein